MVIGPAAAFLLALAAAPAADVSHAKRTAPATFSCRFAYCRQMSSCAEACHKYLVCGFHHLDRDGDGIPCENVCKRLCP